MIKKSTFALCISVLLPWCLATQAQDATNKVSITTDGQFRYINSNGIPYWHGSFPNSGNPNTVQAQDYHFKMPLKPQLTGHEMQLRNNIDFGVGLDGVPFDPGTAGIWNNNRNWRYEAISGNMNLGIDKNNAHVQHNGAYHYHGLPTELTTGLSSVKHSSIVGYAADGFPIYAMYGYAQADNTNSQIKELESSYKLRSGSRPSGVDGPGGNYDGTFTEDYIYVPGSGDLDQCNGREGVTPDYPQGTYAYFITDKFPLIPRCFKGTPDQSFVKQRGDTGRSRGGPRGGQNRPHPMEPPR